MVIHKSTNVTYLLWHIKAINNLYGNCYIEMQKKLLSGSTVNGQYCFSFQALLDQNIRMDCHAIFFLHRFNLVLKDYIVLDKTHSFHRISGDLPKNLQTLSVCKKILSPRKLGEKTEILCCEHIKTMIHFRKNVMAQPSFYY